jgi:hypothetical protein
MEVVSTINDPTYIDPKYNEVSSDIKEWVTGQEAGEKLLSNIARKMLIFFPTEVDFNNSYGLINNFIMKVLRYYLLKTLIIIILGIITRRKTCVFGY